MRAIDGDRLLTDRMKSKYYHLPNGDIAIPIIDIEHAPTIEPERKRGKWELSSIMHSTPPTYVYRCSECGMEAFGMHDFCPYCGARMEDEG